METDAARTGKEQGRATRDAGSGRPQYPARNRTEAFAQAKEGAPLAWPPLARSDSRTVAPSPAHLKQGQCSDQYQKARRSRDDEPPLHDIHVKPSATERHRAPLRDGRPCKMVP